MNLANSKVKSSAKGFAMKNAKDNDYQLVDSKSRVQGSSLKVVNVLLTILIDKILQTYFGRISDEINFAGQAFALEE